MAVSRLRLSLVQAQLAWRDPARNRAHLESLLVEDGAAADMVVLPETFTTGFLGDGDEAEDMHGPTVAWMQSLAAKYQAAVTGSVAIEAEGRRNRLLWAAPGEALQHYDKRHLFSYAGEDQRYVAGAERKVFPFRGWRICPQICYDIRFPVWCRNRNDYDLLLVVANWPAPRVAAWRSLLQARAIENQAYVVAVNRVGEDGNGKSYPGNSLVFDPLGETVLDMGGEEAVGCAELELDRVRRVREELPFHREADYFEIIS
ncbi:MAG: amidohydrolase [Xanthomonadales bacterium]|nr:amidohydrolase [Xanthomonadales bacterium]